LKMKGVDIVFDTHIKGLVRGLFTTFLQLIVITKITRYGANLRGEIKTKARPLVKEKFGLNNPTTPKGVHGHELARKRKEQVTTMRTKVEDLLDQDAFTYAVSSHSPLHGFTITSPLALGSEKPARVIPAITVSRRHQRCLVPEQ
jgi:hypothetical protein